MSRFVRDQYGTIDWVVTFTYNPGQTPPGAGNMPAIVIDQDYQNQNITAGDATAVGVADDPLVTELVQGSTSLSGSFTVDYNDPNGPRTVAFDESDDR